jgi:XTP/dITP diphosphohydrolase
LNLTFLFEGRMSNFAERLIVATRNRKKTEEIRTMLTGVCEVIDVAGLEAEGIQLPEIEETGTTFLENATLKAEGISREVAGLVLADDSGLEVDGLGGEPGVWSSSYGGEEGNHAKNNERLARELAAVPEEKRTGRFQCVMVLARGGERLAHFLGTVEGRLLTEAQGAGGFGYDPYFEPEGYSKTFAELGAEVKNGMSHRGRALSAVVSELNRFLEKK